MADAYRVRLEVFEGPLDLLLHLIRAEKVDIHDIPIARITTQYLEYLAGLEALDLDRAAEFLLMAATLMEIKARMLLPRHAVEHVADAEPEPDPRAELVRRLLEYRSFRQKANVLQEREREASRRFVHPVAAGASALPPPPPEGVTVADLVAALLELVGEPVADEPAEIAREQYTVRDKMRTILRLLRQAGGSVAFGDLFGPRFSRREVIVTFLALLELVRQRWVTARQDRTYGRIVICRARPAMGR